MDQIGQLHAMLKKAGIDDAKIANGVTLTARGFQKVAGRLGISVPEAESLLRGLRGRLRSEADADELTEAVAPRFALERDYLKNVTIRDGQSGREVYLQGEAAAKLLSTLAAGADEQATLARYMPMMEEDETAHWDAHARTGFYGARGAGCIILAEDTGRILLGRRSEGCEEPGTWGCFGGAIDGSENPVSAVEREVGEEVGYHGGIEAIIPLYVFKKGSFRYHNFLVIVASEFKPHLNWEHDEARWCRFGHWPQPLHFGLKALFSDAESLRKIENRLSKSGLTESILDEDDEDSFEPEMRSNVGTFNFPWKHHAEHGFATARFSGRGDQMKIKVINVRDAQGDVIDAQELLPMIHQQAVDFIGNE